VSGGVFGFGADVDDDQVAVVEALGEFVSADLFEAGAVAEVVSSELIEVVQVSLRQRPTSSPEHSG
jgi:hypothetical protein